MSISAQSAAAVMIGIILLSLILLHIIIIGLLAVAVAAPPVVQEAAVMMSVPVEETTYRNDVTTTLSDNGEYELYWCPDEPIQESCNSNTNILY